MHQEGAVVDDPSPAVTEGVPGKLEAPKDQVSAVGTVGEKSQPRNRPADEVEVVFFGEASLGHDKREVQVPRTVKNRAAPRYTPIQPGNTPGESGGRDFFPGVLVFSDYQGPGIFIEKKNPGRGIAEGRMFEQVFLKGEVLGRMRPGGTEK
jgi:hypothetical protein